MERNRKAGSKSSRNAAINNTEFIVAVKTLKLNNIITEDVEIANALNYSKTAISAYLNNKRKVSEIFMIHFKSMYFPKPLFNGSTKDILSLLKANNELLQSIQKELKSSRIATNLPHRHRKHA